MNYNKPVINKAIAAALFGFLGISTIVFNYRYAKPSIHGLHNVTAVKLNKWIKDNKNGSLLVCNVLSEKAFKDCRIEGSKNLPLKDLKVMSPKKISRMFDGYEKIVFYCASPRCTASAQASHILKDHGYQNVYVYEGGTKEWLHKSKQMGSDFICEGKCQMPYLK